MEQQEQKLMREGDLTIVIQLTSLAGTLPLPRFLPRNRLNKERLRYEGRERGRIFLLSPWDRHTICPANLNQWSLHSPVVNLCQTAEDGKDFCGLEKGGGSRGSRSSWSPGLVPLVPDPLASPHCWGLALLGSFSLGYIVPHLKDMSPNPLCKHLVQRSSASLGWAGEHREACLETIADCFSPRWKNICEELCLWWFSGEELPYSPWHQPLPCRDKNPAGTLWWCLVFCSRQARISSVALKCLPFAGKLLL